MPKNTFPAIALLSIFVLSAAPAHAYLQTPDLSMGSQGSEVTELQTILSNLGYFSQQATGYFGNVTRAALEAYQQSAGLAAVGMVNAPTSSSLNAYSAFSQNSPAVAVEAVAPAPVSTEVLRIGSTGDRVAHVQLSLVLLDLLTTDPTSYYGALTQKAVADFQTQNSLPVTGELDSQTAYLVEVAAAKVHTEATTPAS